MKVWDCTIGLLQQVRSSSDGGSDVESEYVDTLYLPFLSKAEQKANPMLKNFVTYTGAGQGGRVRRLRLVGDDRLPRRGEQHGQGNGGVNGVTRKTIFAELNKIHQFDADGMFGTIDLAGRKTSPCHVLLQVKSGDVPAHLPVEGGYVRLRQEECGPGQARRVLI